MSDNQHAAKQKVLIVATHPVQYQVPWFRYLHESVNDYTFEVLYLTLPDATQQGIGFGQAFEWDIPLLDGYNWNQLEPNLLTGSGNLDKFTSLRIKNPKNLIKRLNPSAVLLTGWQSLALVQLLYSCNHLKVPTFIRGDSNNLKPRKQLTKLLHKKLIKRYDKFLAVGKANKNFYIENGAKQSDIYICPHFVDNKQFIKNTNTHSKQRNNLRQKWAILENAFCFCYVGKLNPKKRIMDVLKAFKNLGDNTSHLLVVGDGELMNQAQDYAQRHQLKVTFTGFLNQSEITAAYVVSDCLVLASDYDETWGLVVNEAMACGLPAIVSNRCGCHPDLVLDGQTGYTFEFSDTIDLSAKMKLIAQLDQHEIEHLCNQANKNVIENYSIEKASKSLINALDHTFKRQY